MREKTAVDLFEMNRDFYNFVYEFANDIDVGSKLMDIRKAQVRVEHLTCALRRS